jgi:sulfide:quinone oxidoreductase
MKNLIILGAGTGGTMVANRVVRHLPRGWSLTVVDPEPDHLYQPGLLFVPFGSEDERTLLRPRAGTLHRGVRWLAQAVETVDADRREVVLAGGSRLTYDLLVLASGSRVQPDLTPGLTGEGWGTTMHEFYTLAGARRLREALRSFGGGRLVVDVVEMPIKCPVAPLEFSFLADAWFAERGMRDRVELVYATPLDGPFTKPVCSRVLGGMLGQRGIGLETEFAAGEADGAGRVLRSYDGREIPFDLLVAVPTHTGASFIEAAGLGNELAFVPTEKHTLLAKGHDRIFVLGDATDLPSSKAGSVAHFQSEVVAENLRRAMRGASLLEDFDGHANCFIESGRGKALLVDFNYEVEPLPGSYPLPLVGPFSLLAESRINHWGKLAFKPIYWQALLPGRPIPLSNHMSMTGKRRPPAAPLAAGL